MGIAENGRAPRTVFAPSRGGLAAELESNQQRFAGASGTPGRHNRRTDAGGRENNNRADTGTCVTSMRP